MSVKDLLARYKPAETSVRILLDGHVGALLDDAEAALERAVRNPTGTLKSDVPALQARVDELRVEADAASVTVTMRAMPGALFDELKTAHPPTEAQWVSYREQSRAMPLFAAAPEFNAETLAPDLIAGSVCEIDGDPVDWSVDEGRELWSVLHDGARADLLSAAYEINGRRSARPLSETGTVMTTSTGQDSTTPPHTESPFLSLAEGS